MQLEAAQATKALAVARRACLAAGAVVLRHYQQGQVDVQVKQDASPVTVADIEANEIILQCLKQDLPADAVLSEESIDSVQRLTANRLWIIDPLDGTRDFIERSGDFAVHVGLCVGNKPTVGVVYQPVHRKLFWAVKGQGAWLEENHGAQEQHREPLRLKVSSQAVPEVCRIGVSRLSPSAQLAAFAQAHRLHAQLVPMGASTKMMAVAQGLLEASLCLHGREKEWDTCAPAVIVEEAGGTLTDLDGQPLSYNREDPRHLRGLLVSNGACHQALLRCARPFAEK